MKCATTPARFNYLPPKTAMWLGAYFEAVCTKDLSRLWPGLVEFVHGGFPLMEPRMKQLERAALPENKQFPYREWLKGTGRHIRKTAAGPRR